MFTCEQITKSLIREFLIRRGMKASVNAFDSEYQKNCTEVSRIDLVKSLCMERLIKGNKEKNEPKQTLVEILVDYLLGKSIKKDGKIQEPQVDQKEKVGNSPAKLQKTPPLLAVEENQQNTEPPGQVSRLSKMRKANQPNTNYQIETQQKQDNNEQQQQIGISTSMPQTKVSLQSTTQVTQQNKNNNSNVMDDLNDFDNMFPTVNGNVSQSFSTKPIDQTTSSIQPQQEAQPKKMMNLSKKPSQQPQPQFQNDEMGSNNELLSSPKQIKNETVQSFTYHQLDLEQDYKVKLRAYDLENAIQYNKTSGLANGRKKRNIAQQIEGQTLNSLKKTIFQNSGFNTLGKSWSQGFIFQQEKTFYGLLQKEGGPCGVIAVVQAYYLKHLLLINQNKDSSMKANCLIAAISDVLFKISQKGTGNVILAIQSRASNQNDSVPLEACEQIILNPKTLQQTYEMIYEYKDLLIGDNNNGVSLFFYSAILTKGVDNIKVEMDNEENSLIGNHGHCTQEAVNLLLTGRAVSNCFDGDKTLDENYILKGITERSEFGFLTIFEHFKYLEVGKNLKCPDYPIWIICKEYHYSIIFSTDQKTIMENKLIDQQLSQFDLIFYDELYAPDDLIRLTIRRNGAQKGNQSKQIVMGGGLAINLNNNNNDDELTPSIEMVLRTKWGPNIEVDWNDSMPIL